MSTITFNVAGSASVSVAPERAILNLQVAGNSLVRRDVYDTVVNLHNDLMGRVRQLKDSGSILEFNSTAPVSYALEEHWIADGADEPENRIRYYTRSTIILELEDFAMLADLLAEFSSESLISSSVQWTITDETREQLERKVRAESVVNARSYAEDYATGAGLDVANNQYKLALISISSSSQPQPFRAGAMARSAAVGSAAPVADISPSEITVSDSISAVFEYRD